MVEFQELGWICRKEGNFRPGEARGARGARRRGRAGERCCPTRLPAALPGGGEEERPWGPGSLPLGQLPAPAGGQCEGHQGLGGPQGPRDPGPLGPPRQTRSESIGRFTSRESLAQGLRQRSKTRASCLSPPRISLSLEYWSLTDPVFCICDLLSSFPTGMDAL